MRDIISGGRARPCRIRAAQSVPLGAWAWCADCMCAGGDGEAKAGALFVWSDLRCLGGSAADLADLPETGRDSSSATTKQVTLYVPAGCAHGFQAPHRYCGCFLHDRPRLTIRPRDVSIAFDDPDLAIPWPLPSNDHVVSGPARPAAGRRGQAAGVGRSAGSGQRTVP